LWTGYGPNLARNCVVNATELVAYDQSKQMMLKNGFADNIGTHIACGLSAGLAATLLGSPVDVIKTRVMAANNSGNSPSAPGGPKVGTGPIRIALDLLKTQGPLAFYKGFIPNFARIGSWNIVTWVTLEKLKALYHTYNQSKK